MFGSGFAEGVDDKEYHVTLLLGSAQAGLVGPAQSGRIGSARLAGQRPRAAARPPDRYPVRYGAEDMAALKFPSAKQGVE